MQDNDFTKILGWPGYRVFQHEINEGTKMSRLWVRRRRPLICSGCGKRIRRENCPDADAGEGHRLPLPANRAAWKRHRNSEIISTA